MSWTEILFSSSRCYDEKNQCCQGTHCLLDDTLANRKNICSHDISFLLTSVVINKFYCCVLISCYSNTELARSREQRTEVLHWRKLSC